MDAKLDARKGCATKGTARGTSRYSGTSAASPAQSWPRASPRLRSYLRLRPEMATRRCFETETREAIIYGATITDIQDVLGHESDRMARHYVGGARTLAAAES